MCSTGRGRGADAGGGSMAGYRVAVVGATGAVGREVLEILAARRFPAASVRAIASARSAGKRARRARRRGDRAVGVRRHRPRDLRHAGRRGARVGARGRGARGARDRQLGGVSDGARCAARDPGSEPRGAAARAPADHREPELHDGDDRGAARAAPPRRRARPPHRVLVPVGLRYGAGGARPAVGGDPGRRRAPASPPDGARRDGVPRSRSR